MQANYSGQLGALSQTSPQLAPITDKIRELSFNFSDLANDFHSLIGHESERVSTHARAFNVSSMLECADLLLLFCQWLELDLNNKSATFSQAHEPQQWLQKAREILDRSQSEGSSVETATHNDKAEYLKALYKTADGLLDFSHSLEDLLEFSDPTFDPEAEPLDWLETIEESVALLTANSFRCNPPVYFDPAPAGPLEIDMDRVLFQSLLLNMGEHILRYEQPQAMILSTSCRALKAETYEFGLEWRLHRSNGRQRPSSCLFSILSQRIIELLKAELRVFKGPEQTTYKLTWTGRGRQRWRSKPPRGRALLVCQDSLQTQLYSKWLRQSQWRCDLAESCKEALSWAHRGQARGQHYDLLLVADELKPARRTHGALGWRSAFSKALHVLLVGPQHETQERHKLLIQAQLSSPAQLDDLLQLATQSGDLRSAEKEPHHNLPARLWPHLS